MKSLLSWPLYKPPPTNSQRRDLRVMLLLPKTSSCNLHTSPPPINCTWQSWICLSLVSWNPAVGSHTLRLYETKRYLLGLEQTTWHPAKPQTCELREYISGTTLMLWDHLLHTIIVAMNYWFNLLHPAVYILHPHEAGPQEIGKLSYGCMMLLAEVLGPNTVLVRSYCFLQSNKMRKS